MGFFGSELELASVGSLVLEALNPDHDQRAGAGRRSQNSCHSDVICTQHPALRGIYEKTQAPALAGFWLIFPLLKPCLQVSKLGSGWNPGLVFIFFFPVFISFY